MQAPRGSQRRFQNWEVNVSPDCVTLTRTRIGLGDYLALAYLLLNAALWILLAIGVPFIAVLYCRANLPVVVLAVLFGVLTGMLTFLACKVTIADRAADLKIGEVITCRTFAGSIERNGTRICDEGAPRSVVLTHYRDDDGDGYILVLYANEDRVYLGRTSGSNPKFIRRFADYLAGCLGCELVEE
ncbi:MAG: hypothetical protein ACLQVD_20895 [Capsulimonadaceae bacterium]